MMIEHDGTYFLLGQPKQQQHANILMQPRPAIKEMLYAIVIEREQIKIYVSNGTRFGLDQMKASIQRSAEEGRILKRPELFELHSAPVDSEIQVEVHIAYPGYIQCSDFINRSVEWRDVWRLSPGSVMEVSVPGVFSRLTRKELSFELAISARLEARVLFQFDDSSLSVYELHSTRCEEEREQQSADYGRRASSEGLVAFSPIQKRTMFDMIMSRQGGVFDSASMCAVKESSAIEWNVFMDIIKDNK